MKDFKLYIGEDFSLAGQAVFGPGDTSRSLDDYDITVELSTTPLGSKTKVSTITGSSIKIVRREDNCFALNIPASLSAAMSPGLLTVSISLRHKATGTVSIAECHTIELAQARIAG